MKRVTIRTLHDAVDRCIRESQHEAVVITRHGRPAAVLFGVEGHDWEAVERETDPGFWQMLTERRNQPTTPLWSRRGPEDQSPVTARVQTSPNSLELLKRLGALFARARERRGMSLRAVSERVASETYYGMIERGQRRPSPDTLKQLFLVLEMSPDERSEAQRILEESILVASRERSRARSRRAGLVAEPSARYGESHGPVSGAHVQKRLGRVETELQQLRELLTVRRRRRRNVKS